MRRRRNEGAQRAISERVDNESVGDIGPLLGRGGHPTSTAPARGFRPPSRWPTTTPPTTAPIHCRRPVRQAPPATPISGRGSEPERPLPSLRIEQIPQAIPQKV